MVPLAVALTSAVGLASAAVILTDGDGDDPVLTAPATARAPGTLITTV